MLQKSTIKKNWLSLAPTTRGAIWILASGIFFAGLGVSIRVASREIPTLEVVFFRNFINLIIMLPWLIKIGIGGSIIFSSTIYIAHRESKNHKKVSTTQISSTEMR